MAQMCVCDQIIRHIGLSIGSVFFTCGLFLGVSRHPEEVIKILNEKYRLNEDTMTKK